MKAKRNLVQIPLADLLKLQQPDGKMPPDLKEQVFRTIDQIELTADIIDLCTYKYALTEMSLFGDISEEE